MFDREAVGIKRYNAASVVVAESFNRVVVRGLAERKYNYDIRLTDAGVEIARELMKGRWGAPWGVPGVDIVLYVV